MKITLIKDEKGHTCGWTITAENIDEKLILGSMRNLEFWGSDDDKVEYDGMTADPDNTNYVTSLKYATIKHRREEFEKMGDEIEQQIQSKKDAEKTD